LIVNIIRQIAEQINIVNIYVDICTNVNEVFFKYFNYFFWWFL